VAEKSCGSAVRHRKSRIKSLKLILPTESLITF
jgi:hypothetical protein